MNTVMPVLAPSATMAVFANATAYAAFWPIMYESTSNLQAGVWDKGRIGMGSPLRVQTEFILVGTRKPIPGRRCSLSNVFRHPVVKGKDKVHPAQSQYLCCAN